MLDYANNFFFRIHNLQNTQKTFFHLQLFSLHYYNPQPYNIAGSQHSIILSRFYSGDVSDSDHVIILL